MLVRLPEKTVFGQSGKAQLWAAAASQVTMARIEEWKEGGVLFPGM